MTHPTDELALLNKLIELGAAAAQESAKANSDDGMAGSIAQGRFYELRHQMRALLAEQARTQTHKAEDAPTERDAQDAARYRWLRDGELTADYPYPVMRMGGSRVDDQTIWNDELDAAIDAAMAKD